MRYAASRFAGSTQRAGESWSLSSGRGTDAYSATPVGGSGALSTRLAVVLLLLAMAVLASIFALSAPPALAEGEHGVGVTAEFGPDGTAGTTFGTDIQSLAYQQATNHVFVLSVGPSQIHGFTASPGSFTPLEGNFPVTVPCVSDFYAEVDVDNSAGGTAGRLYLSPDCFTGHSNSIVEAFTAAGAPYTTGWPVSTGGENCGLAVDNVGNVWATAYPGTAKRFPPTGGAPDKEVSTAGGAEQLCRQAVDLGNNDLYLDSYASSGTWQYTAASNYLTKKLITPQSGNDHMAINSARGVIYVGGPSSGGTIKAFSTTTGELVETITGLGEIEGIAVSESDDTLYVADGISKRVEELAALEAPKATTGGPVANTKVSGSVDPDGAGEVLECYFQFGPSPAFGSKEDCDPATPYNAVQAVTAELPGLTMETLYYYRLVAKNANGPGFGKTETILPHNVQGVKTEPADELTRTTAKLHGSFEGTNDDTDYFFEWGPSASPYANKTSLLNAGVTTGPTPTPQAISGLTGGTTYHFRLVAENSLGETKGEDREFSTMPAVKDLTTTAATDIVPDSATLNGILDPDGIATTFYFEWGKTTSYGQTTPLPPGTSVGVITPGDQAVSSAVDGLEPGTLYHYRIVAINSAGTTTATNDVTFKTPQAPSIESFTSSNVTATSAEIKAKINPNDEETSYHVDYGLTPEYGSVAPTSVATIPASNTSEPVVVQLAGLQGLTYHFRIVAESKWGTAVTEDQTFEFNPPTGCPNHTLRQQTGAGYLPDCRAYELVSPTNAEGAVLLPQGAISTYASSEGRFSFAGAWKAIPGSGEPINGNLNADMYVASRTSNGWNTRYVGIPGSTTLSDAPSPDVEIEEETWKMTHSDRALNRFLVWDRRQAGLFTGGSLEGTFAPYLLDNHGKILRRLPTNVEEVPGYETDSTLGGFEGDVNIDQDLTHYVFSSIKSAFTPEGITESPGSAYDNDIANETVTLISKTEGGANIPKDPLAGVVEEYIQLPAVSADASHILMSTAAPGGLTHLYMRVNHLLSYDISVDQSLVNQGVKFEGMSSDGTEVFFTTAKPMVAGDTDTSIDLYMWSESTDSLTRLSVGAGSIGNTDNCAPQFGWTSKCNVVVVPLTTVSEQQKLDSAFAADSGEIYFYSPEQLDGARGIADKRNLYVYRKGAVQHVATLEPNRPVKRINVSPDNSHMAFITASKLTSYENAGKDTMYLYDPLARTIRCVSCIPNGDPPSFDTEGSMGGRFMTDDGRAFFATKEALVPQDANGIVDVYEFVDGRPQLISSGAGEIGGTSQQPVGLMGVSGDGVDAFISTYDTMVGQDENGALLKFYDARTNGGFPFDKPPAPCVAADECHGADSSPPAPLEIGTGANLGAGGNAHAVKKRRPHTCRKKRRCHRKKSHEHRGGGRNA